jgi:PD-(D/E)XK nuclease superfamily protein
MTVSHSRLKTFESCAAKYDYRYLQKIDKPYVSSPQAARGSAIHELIEQSIKAGTDTPEEAGHLVANYIRGLRFSGGIIHAEYDLKLDREWMLVTEGDYWLHAILDLLVLFPTRANLDDWKTGKIYPEHVEQGELYAIALFSGMPELEEIEVQFHYIDLGKVVRKLYLRSMLGEAKERWDRKFTRMETATEFIPNPGYLCRYCQFNAASGGPCRF